MITSLRLVNFKNFADETLHLGPFTLIVGANASGKSNIRDAFRFLHGISRDYTLAEILGGKYGAEWRPIRGVANEIMRFGQDEFLLEIGVKADTLITSDISSLRFSIQIERNKRHQNGFRVASETLNANPSTTDTLTSEILYTSDPPPSCSFDGQRKVGKLPLYFPGADKPIEVEPGKPGLFQLDLPLRHTFHATESASSFAESTAGIEAKVMANFARLVVLLQLSGLRFLELSPERMRAPAVPGATRLGDLGDDLSSVLESIYADPKRRDVLLSWIHELTPMDVKELEFPTDPSGRIHLRIKEGNGREVSAYSASDGTLRFLGVLAALLNVDESSPEDFGLWFFEEIDNGIHPARLHLLLDLIERQTAKGKIQVVATTHSPDVLNLINDTTFENAVVVYRDEDSADAVIRRVAELPNAGELRQSQGLGRLHASGWMENVLSFAEADSDDGEGGN
jgi:AAA15 family ATPase/GTPase